MHALADGKECSVHQSPQVHREKDPPLNDARWLDREPAAGRAMN
jgi:hypothetical protein